MYLMCPYCYGKVTVPEGELFSNDKVKCPHCEALTVSHVEYDQGEEWFSLMPIEFSQEELDEVEDN